MLLYRFFKKMIVSTILFAIFLLLLFNVIYGLLNILPNKNKLFAHIATELLHQPIVINQAEMKGFSYEPTFAFYDITVGNVQLHELEITLDLWQSIHQKKWVTRKIVIAHLKMRIDKNAKGIISISGLSSKAISFSSRGGDNSPFIAWIAAQPEIDLWHAHVDFFDDNRAHLPMQALNLTIKNKDDFHILSANAQFKQAKLTSNLKLIAHMQKNNARIYVQGAHVNLLQWTPLLAGFPALKQLQAVNGVANFKTWIDVVNHQVQQVQTELTMHNITSRDVDLTELSANVIARLSNHIWQINVDSLKFSNPTMNVYLQSLMQFDARETPALLFFVNGSVNGLTVNHIEGSLSTAGKHYFHVILKGILNPDALSRRNEFEFLKLIHGRVPFYTEFDLPKTLFDGFPDMTISLGQLYFMDQDWKNLTVKIASNNAGAAIQLHNAEMDGDLFLPNKNESPIRAHFRYLFLRSNATAKEEAPSTLNPVLIPPMHMTIDDLHINNRSDGRLKFVTEPIEYGLAISDIQLQSPLFLLNAKGYWILRNRQSETFMSGKADSPDLGSLLAQRHLSSRLKSGKFSTEFSLTWPGSPQSFVFARATGKVDLKITKGRILQLDSDTESSLNIARIFNILSMETLAHVLTFDIKSIGKKGFPFDYLQGNLELQNGALLTRDVEMDGTLAKVNFAGRVSLSDAPNDLSMTVYPKVSTSVMTLVGMTGGPIVGAAAWLANKIVSPVVGRIMEMHYHISGTWKKLDVKRVS